MGMNDFNEMTVARYAQDTGANISTLRYRLKNAGFAFDREAIVTPELRAILDGNKSSAGARKRTPPAPPAPASTPVPAPAPHSETPPVIADNPPAFGRQFLLDVPTAAELLAVLIGSSWLFGWLGAIVAAAAISFYAHTALELRAGKSAFAQDFGLFVCAALGCVFCWLHGQTFWKVYSGAQDLKFAVCCGCAFLLSCISFAALVQTRVVQT